MGPEVRITSRRDGVCKKNAYNFCGSIIHEGDVSNTQVSYRFHLSDPVRFQKRIKVTMETGHGNHLRDDWSTTAYWYQTLPGPKLNILPVEKRLPRRPIMSGEAVPEPSFTDMNETQQKVAKQRSDRYEIYLKDRQTWLDRRAADSQQRAIKNVEIAKEIRKRWLMAQN